MLSQLYKYLPLIVFVAIWSVVLYLYQLELYNIRVVRSGGVFILLMGISAFVGSYLLFTLFDRNSIVAPVEPVLNHPLLAVLVVGLVVTDLVGTYFVIQTMADLLGGVDVYTQNPLKVRYQVIEFQVNPLTPPPLIYKVGNYLINIGFVSVLFGGVLLTQQTRLRWIGLIAPIAMIFTSIVFLGRYMAFSAVIFFFLSFVITTYFLANEQRKKRLWEFVLYSTLFVGILGGLTYLVIQTRGVGRILDVEEYIIKTGYLYVTGGVSAFDQFLLDDFNYAYGQSSLRSFFKWLARVGIWPDDNLFVVHEPFIKVTPSIEINTYTYAKSFYEDFGIYGVLVGSFIYAAITKLIMVHSLKRFSFFYIMLSVTMIFSLLMTFYSFYFHSVTTIIYRLVVVFAIQYFLSKKLIQ